MLLEVEGLTRRFGGLVAVDGLDMHVESGEVVGLIGPNGAGKTTAFNLLTGFIKPTGGRVLFAGEDITGKRPYRVAAKGMVRTFQITNIYPDFTVLENLRLACHLQVGQQYWGTAFRTRGSRAKDRVITERARQILGTVHLDSMEGVIAGTLAHGYKNLLGIAIALAADPRLLLLDEPLAGMNASEVSETLDVVASLRQSGLTVLMIEHNMRAAMSLCDRLVVISFGKKIAEGTPGDIQCNQAVIEAYLGADEDAACIK
jgi:branched-chain amino acid transport system ATP-binding protein